MSIIQFQDVGVTPLIADTLLQVTQTGRTFTNEGASSAINLTLPSDSLLGTVFTFTVVASQTITILPNAGQTLRLGTASLVSLSSNNVGSSIVLTRIANNIWNAVSAAGNWGVTSVVPAFPVGAIFLSAVSTNPATLLGYGTWLLVSQGQLLAGFKSGDPDFGTLGATGGSKTHTLTVAELAAHHHRTPASTNPTVGSEGLMGSDGPSDDFIDGDTTDTGSATPFSILPPYLVVTVWQRTA